MDLGQVINPAATLIGLGSSASKGSVGGMVSGSVSVITQALPYLGMSFEVLPVIGTVAAIFVSQAMGFIQAGALEKQDRTLRGVLDFQNATIDILENGPSAWFHYTEAELDRITQLARPDSMKPYFANPGPIVWNDDTFSRYAPYLPTIEARAVMHCIANDFKSYDDWLALTRQQGDDGETIMIKLKDEYLLPQKNLPYCYPWDMAQYIMAGNQGFSLFEFFDYIRFRISADSNTQVIQKSNVMDVSEVIENPTVSNMPPQASFVPASSIPIAQGQVLSSPVPVVIPSSRVVVPKSGTSWLILLLGLGVIYAVGRIST